MSEGLNFGNEKNVSKEQTPVGDIVLGLKDPRTLQTEDEFNNDQDALFHVSKGPLDFDKKIDYATFQGKYSSTLGNGLYCTDDLNALRRYEEDRSSVELAAEVTALIPFRAKMFDFRAQADMSKNGHVPTEIFEAYRSFVTDLIKKKYPTGSPSISENARALAVYDLLSKYRSYLNALKFRSGSNELQPVELRQMLGEGVVVVEGTTIEGVSPEQGSVFFRSFMMDRGYDGVICLEGGDGWSEGAPSFVFYRTDRIGTFESWHNESEEQSPLSSTEQ